MNEYDQIARWYDLYVQVDRDLPFFQRHARPAAAVLDIMAGTGRVSLAMAEANKATVTCIDRSRSMLAELRRKRRDRSRVRAIHADACHLPLGRAFDLVVIPFNSLAEIVAPAARRQVLAEAWRVLQPGGVFICTLHNPIVRRRSLDGVLRTLGTFTLPDGRRLEVTVAGALQEGNDDVAISRQTYRLVGQTGSAGKETTQNVEFALVERDEVETCAAELGFHPESLYGDYDETAFDSDHSPFLIWRFGKPRENVPR